MGQEHQVAAWLTRIDGLKARLDALGQLPENLLAQLRAHWEVTHTYHSNAIEGSTLTLGETKAILLDGVTIRGKPLREHMEAMNHRDAMRHMYRLAAVGTPFSEEEILALHRAILTGIQSEEAGKYRTVRVRVAGSERIFPNPAKVPELMAAFVGELETLREHPVILASRAHYGLVAIHPFVDGNGRTARLLMNLVLVRHGYPPACLRLEDRPRYYDALDAANRGNMVPFNSLVAEAAHRALEDVLAHLT